MCIRDRSWDLRKFWLVPSSLGNTLSFLLFTASHTTSTSISLPQNIKSCCLLILITNVCITFNISIMHSRYYYCSSFSVAEITFMKAIRIFFCEKCFQALLHIQTAYKMSILIYSSSYNQHMTCLLYTSRCV